VAAWCPPMMQTTGGASLDVDAEETAQAETVQAKAA
jgi:ParB family chromosome partitioning protein